MVLQNYENLGGSPSGSGMAELADAGGNVLNRKATWTGPSVFRGAMETEAAYDGLAGSSPAAATNHKTNSHEKTDKNLYPQKDMGSKLPCRWIKAKRL